MSSRARCGRPDPARSQLPAAWRSTVGRRSISTASARTSRRSPAAEPASERSPAASREMFPSPSTTTRIRPTAASSTTAPASCHWSRMAQGDSLLRRGSLRLPVTSPAARRSTKAPSILETAMLGIHLVLGGAGTGATGTITLNGGTLALAGAFSSVMNANGTNLANRIVDSRRRSGNYRRRSARIGQRNAYRWYEQHTEHTRPAGSNAVSGKQLQYTDGLRGQWSLDDRDLLGPDQRVRSPRARQFPDEHGNR